MTKLELIQMIGDILTQIDVEIGSLLPSDPHQQGLQDLRIQLDDQQRKLTRQVFDENSAAFQAAAQKLQEINGQIGVAIGQVQRIEDTIAGISQFLATITGLLTTL